MSDGSLMQAWALGASLYVPALHPDLVKIANAEKVPQIKSMIICTEDAVAEQDVERCIESLAHFLPLIQRIDSRYRFIRVRNPTVLRRVLALPGIDNLDGFVLPKFDSRQMPAYFELLQETSYSIMPTLETAAVFDAVAMRRLARQLARSSLRERIPVLRIGGNDLLNLLRIRRPRGLTWYETPIAAVIAQLVTTFIPSGFTLSAPVYDYLNDEQTLAREIGMDLAHGLVGKTAIHPTQIALIQQHYAVSEPDYQDAQALLSIDSPAVFKQNDAMCETATHIHWARQILCRHAHYGLRRAAHPTSLRSG
ncbi:MAG: HpcH/HpaI aldolase/citrate lyase family protein [Methylococcales bacterium]|nr:HpcH/HpaI aldolase/citrate lyase family protein [Methylococcales bacterium]